MAIRYVDDLYPAADPRDGTRILRFTHHQKAHYEAVRNGTGAGEIQLRGTTSDAQAIDPTGLQYVRKVRVNTAVADGSTLSGSDELVVGGYWFEQGDFLALDRKRLKTLSFGGAGTLAYLDREIMWSHSYVAGLVSGFVPQDPFDNLWRLWNQGTAMGGDKLGAVLWRAIREGLAYRTGATYTHRHADGIEYTDAHDDDKLETAIPFVTLGFDQFEDSSGNAWTVGSGEFEAQVGDSLYEVTKRLMEAGLYVELDPDTFELRAWEVANHGRDRTGLTWGADVVRFNPPEAPSTLRTAGNILNDLKRALRPFIKVTSVLAGGGEDTYALATASGTVPWHRFKPLDINDTTALQAAASRDITRRNDAGDTVLVRSKVAPDPANGYYLPEEHAKLDDLVTVHSGTDTWDWDESSYPVAKWSVTSRRTGAPDVFYHLGASYHAGASKEFAGGAGVGHHTHPPNPRLCPPGGGYIETDARWRVLDITGASIPAGWNEAGFDDSAWPLTAGEVTFGSGLKGIRSETDSKIPDERALARFEFWLDESALTGADVVLKYSADNAASYYVNGTAIATLGTIPIASDVATHRTSDHATTLPRSAFRAGLNCVGIHFANEQAGSVGATPPGGMAVALLIEIATGNGNGTSKYAARCDHTHHASEIGENSHGNVQVALDDHDGRLDALETGAGLSWFDVTTYGATGDGTTDDTSAVNSAIAALVSAGRGVLYFPAGTYKTTAALSTLSVPCIVRGDGANNYDGDDPITLVTTTSATANVFTVTADHVKFEQIAFRNDAGSTPSAGSAISTQGSHLEQRVDYDGVTVHGFYIGIDVQVGAQWTMQDCFIYDSVQYGVKIRNTVNSDAGDWTISSTEISSGSHAAAAHIRIESSGGGKIVNCKLNKGYPPDAMAVNGIDLALSGATATSVLMISNTSIENVSGHAISMTQAGTSQYSQILLTGLQIALYSNNSGKAVSIVAEDAAALQHIGIANCSFYTNGTARSAIQLTNANNVVLTGNVLAGNFTSLYTNTSSTNVVELGGGVTDHGALTGLGDDDHTQYLNEARHDALAHVGLLTVDPGTPTYDDSGDDVVVTYASKWGYGADGPYFDAAGVTAGEEAILALDPTTGELAVIPYNP